MPQSEGRNVTAARVPEPPLPTRMTRIEQAAWVVYALVALLLLVIPWATHSFGAPDIAAWVVLLATISITAFWLRTGALRGPEWLKPDDYEQFLKQIQRIPGADESEPAPPTPTALRADQVRSGVPPPPP